MANPGNVSLTADTWVKVATNVTHGVIDKRSEQRPAILQTYRTSGQAAPATAAEGILWDTTQAVIEASAGIDVYLMAVGEDAVVRVSV